MTRAVIRRTPTIRTGGWRPLPRWSEVRCWPLGLNVGRRLVVACQVGLPWEVIAVLVGAVLAALTLGYLAGLWSFKIKNRWCPRCGTTTAPLGHQQDAYASGLAPVGDARVQP